MAKSTKTDSVWTSIKSGNIPALRNSKVREGAELLEKAHELIYAGFEQIAAENPKVYPHGVSVTFNAKYGQLFAFTAKAADSLKAKGGGGDVGI